MNYSVVGILDLPDEILLIILAKLKYVDILYSLLGVHERFNKIILHTNFTRSIDLIALSSNGVYDSLTDQMLSRFCLEILPQIHQHIECLTLEPLSMKCILHASNYPNLHKLNLVKLNIDQALYYFNDESPFAHIFKNQISRLVVTVTDETKIEPLIDITLDVYGSIFTLFTSLTHLTFGTYNAAEHLPLSVYCLPANICLSSNIVYLSIRVNIFDDCLCLLNGRLRQMNTFIVTVNYFLPIVSMNIDKTRRLHNLKCFSLMSHSKITTYDNQIVRLLRQMVQLEKLTLSLNVYNRTNFIDGTHLNKEILSQMSHLHTFNFHIVTHSVITDDNHKSVDDIRSTFVQDVDGYIDYLSNGEIRCHIYSLPCTMEDLQDITNHFPGGRLMSIRTLSIFDRIHPFEHDFFRRISHSFPLLNSLTVFSSNRQIYNDQKTSSIVEFLHLSKLNLIDAHIDYVEQFLLDTNTHLPCLDHLHIQSEHLKIVTENFTSNATRVICAKLKRLYTTGTFVYPNDFHLYFPLL